MTLSSGKENVHPVYINDGIPQTTLKHLLQSGSPLPLVHTSPNSLTPQSLPEHEMQSPDTFFVSPLETLLGSLENPDDDITVHDIIDAYSLFSSRLRSQIRTFLRGGEENSTPFTPIRDASSQLMQVLRRDVRRVLIDPSYEYARLTSCDESYSMSQSIDRRWLQFAKDLALLSHSALRLVSEIFAFPSFLSLFPGTF